MEDSYDQVDCTKHEDRRPESIEWTARRGLSRTIRSALHARQCKCLRAAVCEPFANVLTDMNDIPLKGLNAPAPADGFIAPGYEYELQMGKGFKTNSGACEGLNDGHSQLLVLKPQPKLPPVDSKKCFMIFKLPKPDQLFPLIPEWVFIHKGKATLWLDPDKDPSKNCDQRQSDQSQYFFGQYARALRFIYLNCGSAPTIELRSSPKNVDKTNIQYSLKEFESATVGFDPNTFHFTLRFASNGPEPDDNHQDAYNCFQTMRTLVNDTCAWRVDYDNLYVSKTNAASRSLFGPWDLENHSGNPPVDCHAAVLVVQDPN
jgi:hypothetical protein